MACLSCTLPNVERRQGLLIAPSRGLPLSRPHLLPGPDPPSPRSHLPGRVGHGAQLLREVRMAGKVGAEDAHPLPQPKSEQLQAAGRGHAQAEPEWQRSVGAHFVGMTGLHQTSAWRRRQWGGCPACASSPAQAPTAGPAPKLTCRTLRPVASAQRGAGKEGAPLLLIEQHLRCPALPQRLWRRLGPRGGKSDGGGSGQQHKLPRVHCSGRQQAERMPVGGRCAAFCRQAAAGVRLAEAGFHAWQANLPASARF